MRIVSSGSMRFVLVMTSKDVYTEQPQTGSGISSVFSSAITVLALLFLVVFGFIFQNQIILNNFAPF